MRVVLISILSAVWLNAGLIDGYLKELALQAKKENPNFKGFSFYRGKKIFYSAHIGRKGKKISCASCHTRDLTKTGENVFTGKEIAPLSPEANPKRFTDLKKVKKWLRRNFRDVYDREGTATEKGDVLTFILNYR